MSTLIIHLDSAIGIRVAERGEYPALALFHSARIGFAGFMV
jgi:hypothetical protein